MSENSRNPIAPSLAEAVATAADAPAPTAPASPAVAGAQNPHLESAIVDVLKTIFDPEIPVNIYEIGLIYNVDVQPGGKVAIKMTLTSPACPAAQEIPAQVKERTESVAGVTSADVEIVWDPAWSPAMMSEAARLQLGFF
jgi:FeS assembly SUF system protein